MSDSVQEFKYSFVNEPDDALKCLICFDIANDPMQHEECGKLFCKECIERLGKRKPCPNCKTRGSQYYRDNKSKSLTVCSALCVQQGSSDHPSLAQNLPFSFLPHTLSLPPVLS